MNEKTLDKILFILILAFIDLLIQLITLYPNYKYYLDVWIQVIGFVASILAIYEYIKRK